MNKKKAGNLWLQDYYKLSDFSFTHCSYIGNNDKIELTVNGMINQFYGPKYAPANDTPFEHLEFSLKYDDLDLSFFKAVFEKIPETSIIEYVCSSPSGKYSRKIGFLYEFITQKHLNLPIIISGNYVDLLDNNKYISGRIIKDSKWRINNNLPGTVMFCPVIRRTPILDELLKWNIPDAIAQLKKNYSDDIFRRASNYLYSKETRSSYEIEKEKPSPGRMERFIALLEKAGNKSDAEILSEKKLTSLQNAIVDSRFAATGYRDFQNYIGQTFPDFTEKIHYICPPKKYVFSLMEGLKSCSEKSTGSSSVIRAAIIAFGFVFIHPFEDGNGRLHRFLFHDTLVRDGIVPEGLIIPVSAYLLNNIREYDQTLENYSKVIMNKIRYIKKENGEIEVSNPEEVEGHFRYPDLTSQSIFLAQTIQNTINNDMPNELLFIQRYDELKTAIQNIVDMPDKTINLMIIFLHQNRGVFPKRRRKFFHKLTEDEIRKMENAYQEVFEIL